MTVHNKHRHNHFAHLTGYEVHKIGERNVFIEYSDMYT